MKLLFKLDIKTFRFDLVYNNFNIHVIDTFSFNYRMDFDDGNPKVEDNLLENPEDNPWFEKTLEEFLYYCCPECDERNQSKEMFLKHALEIHPKSKDLKSKDIMIKQEFVEDINYQNDFIESKELFNEVDSKLYYDNENGDYEDFTKIVKCEINEGENEINFDEDTQEDDKNLIKKYKCNQCPKSFSKKYGLAKHVKHIHTKKHKCDKCDKAYGDPQKLKDHVMSVHEGVKHLKCKFCNKAFGYGSNLSAHIKSKHGGLNTAVNTCAFCKAIFHDYEKLKEHIINFHADSNNSNDENIKNEPIDSINVINEETIVKNHKCDLCEKAFDTKYHLTHHIKHIHIKEHKCSLCEKAYGSAAKLKDHFMSIHEGVKIHKCDFCDRRFAYQTALSGMN